MDFIAQLSVFAHAIWQILTNPAMVALLLGSSFLGIIFGALPGLTATLGVALLTTLTYSMDLQTALISLIAMYVGAVYGGSYPAILINIPGTAAGAATAMDGYPMAQRGEGGKALGMTTTASFIGTLIGMVALIALAPLISEAALQFTSYEFFLLALFGIIISGTLTSKDLVYKGWIAGLLGLALSTIGRDQLQFFPRFTFGLPELDGGIEVVPVLIGAFAIPHHSHPARQGSPRQSPARQARAARIPCGLPQSAPRHPLGVHRRGYRCRPRRRRGYRRLGVLRYRPELLCPP